MAVCQTVVVSFVRFCVYSSRINLSHVNNSRRFLEGVFSLAKRQKSCSAVAYLALKLSIALAIVQRVGQSSSRFAAIVKTVRQLSSA